ncbi:MAG: DMT family transporter [Bacilli bacterium]|nr:DMT family transporter [Bacilli bacterium]
MVKNRSMIFINIAVFLFGLAGLFAKWIDVPAIGITLGRVFFSSISLYIYSFIVKENIRVEKKHFILLVISGIILAFHWWSFLYSIQISTVAIGTITFSTFPLFITIIESIRNQKISILELVSSLLIILGVFITIPEFSLSNDMFVGIIIGILSALSYALLTLMNRYFSIYYSSTTIALYEQSSATVILLPTLLFINSTPTFKDISLLIFLGIVTTALAHTLFITSLKHVEAHKAGIISAMESVYSILLAYLFLHEIPTVREIVGAIIIISVVIMTQLKRCE